MGVVPTGAETPGPTDPQLPDPASSPVSILGPSRLDAAALVAVYQRTRHTARLTVSLPELAQLFIEEGTRYGVRADIAWAQTMLETAWLTYPDYGQVHPPDNNYAGIGAYDHGKHGFGYPDARSGVRAQMQLLRQYADPRGPASIADPLLVRAPRSKWGIAPTWYEMGNGNWATSTTYAQKVTSIYFQMVGIAPVLANRAAPDPGPVMRPGDGLWLAGLDGHVYDVGDARFWGSAGGKIDDTTVAGIAMTRSRQGYWLATAAPPAPPPDRVDPPAAAFAPGDRVIAIAAAPGGSGYWLASARGRVVSVGSAGSFGDAYGKVALDDPVVDLAASPLGNGYWLLTRSGRVLAFGKAGGYGSLADEPNAALPPSKNATVSPPVAVALEASLTGEGYWIVRSDGNVFGRGDVVDFLGTRLRGAPVTAAVGWAE